MSAIQDCLSRFTVAVWSGGPKAPQDIEDAVRAYVEAQGESLSAQHRALMTLRDCYGRVKTESPLSDVVRSVIDARLASYAADKAAA